MSVPPNDVATQLGNERFEALVAKGIHAILFAVTPSGTDKTRNLLHGYPVGGFQTSGETADMEEFQDQIRGGNYKTYIGGAIDPGDITFNAYFAPTMGKPEIEGVINSTVLTPQFILQLARKQSDTMLQGFFAAGVNYLGGNDIKGDYGKVIGSSLKFKISGEPLVGYAKVGPIAMSLYTAGVQTASAAPVLSDPVTQLLNA
jgi:hypothetical protein